MSVVCGWDITVTNILGMFSVDRFKLLIEDLSLASATTV